MKTAYKLRFLPMIAGLAFTLIRFFILKFT